MYLKLPFRLVFGDGQRLDCRRERVKVGIAFRDLEEIAQVRGNGWWPE